MRTLLTSLCASLILLAGCVAPSHLSDAPLKDDAEVTRGVLDNGLAYTLYEHHAPKGRVYIRLIVNAGSLNEDEDQKGIAHLVEHMAFNGSKRFPKNTIINALERLGMKFAQDINAFTDFENTVYTLNLENDPKSVKEALDIISEWMYHLTILPEDVDGERGIVEEEWRRRLSPLLRLGDKKSLVEMAGSRYAERDPIGDMSIIRTIPAERVKAFYKRWYRPDNMRLFIVGDFDTSTMTKAMKETLDLPETRPTTPLPTIDSSVPVVPGWRVASVSEPGISTAAMEMSWLKRYTSERTEREYRQDLIESLVIGLVNQRLADWEKRQGKAAVESNTFYRTVIGRDLRQYLFLAQLNNTDYKTTLKNLFTFVAQLRQQGFTDAELKRAVNQARQRMERNRDVQPGSLTLADTYLGNVAMDQPIIGRDDVYRLNNAVLGSLTTADLNQAFNEMTDCISKLLIVTEPYPAQGTGLTATNVEALYNAEMAKTQPTWTRIKPKHVTLPTRHYESGSMEKEAYYKDLNITVYRLSNGSRLVYHPSDKTPDQVFFKALTDGGLRGVAPENYSRLRRAVGAVDDAGVGPLSSEDIQRLFIKNPVAIASIADETRQGFAVVGQSNRLKDLLTLFRLKLEGTPITDEVMLTQKLDLKTFFAERDQETQFMEAVERVRYPNIPTIYKENEAVAMSETAETLRKLYDEQLLGNTDFTYFIIGDVPQRTVENLAREYLATVPVKTHRQAPYFFGATTPKTPLAMTGNDEERALVNLYYTTPLKWSPGIELSLELLGDVITERFRATLREAESGIYTVSTDFTADKTNDQVEAVVEFTCDPKRVESLTKEAEAVIADLGKNGIDPKLLAKLVDERKRQVHYHFDSLVALSSLIEKSFMTLGNPDILYTYNDYDRLGSSLFINTLAGLLFTDENHFRATLTP